MSAATAPGRFGPLVLCYHAVSDTWDHQLAVTPAAFEQQLRSLLRRGFRSLPAAALLGHAGKGLHVTFDDGFRNVLQALEPLERLGIHATIFACPTFAADGRPFDAGKLAPEAAAHPDDLATLTFGELRELAERGVEVGSHTVTHARLTELDDAALDDELRRSKEQLEDELHRRCAFIAYPFGAEDARVRAAARRAGYEAAFSMPGRRSPVDAFGLPRVGIYRKDDALRTWLKTSPPGRLLVSRHTAKPRPPAPA